MGSCTLGSFHKIGWYGVAMNQKRNRKRWHCVHWNSMIIQRSDDKPVGRRRGIRGAINIEEQESTASINMTIRITNGHHGMPLTPHHTNDHQYRHCRTQLNGAVNPTNSPPTNVSTIMAATQHDAASTMIEVQ